MSNIGILGCEMYTEAEACQPAISTPTRAFAKLTTAILA
jgi:hypothetical protein